MINIHYTGHHYSRTYGFVGEWNEENMEIQYVTQHPMAELRHEHSATMRLLLEETLGTFNGYFFVTLFLNQQIQRPTFGYVTRSCSFNDIHFRLHVLHPYVPEGKEASNYFNYSPFFCHKGAATQGTVRVHFNILS